MKKKVRSVRIEKAANGHCVTTEYEPSEGKGWEPGPAPHVFGAGEKNAMMDHIVGQLGGDDAGGGDAEPDADDRIVGTISAHNARQPRGRRADVGKSAAYFKELRARKGKGAETKV